MNVNYTLAQLRTPDFQYKDCLQEILRNGIYTKNPFQKNGRYTKLGLPPMIFDLSNGFPIITERDLGKFWKAPIGELIAFINGARTLENLEKFGCKWWTNWATTEKCAEFGLETGDLGPGSYGAAFANFPTSELYRTPSFEGPSPHWEFKPFNQFEHVIKQIKEFPELATHKITSWIPQYCIQHSKHKRKVVVAPCHGDIQITILDGKLTLHMVQRSGDFPIGVPSNMIQYAALTIMMAQVTGFEPHQYMHYVVNAQIYEDQVETVETVLSRKPTIFPSVYLNEEGLKIDNIFDFRPEHFELRDYHPHPAIKIPATI